MATELSMDALLPAKMAAKAESVGVKKAHAPLATVFVLAILAGAFVALGGVFATSTTAGYRLACRLSEIDRRHCLLAGPHPCGHWRR